MDRKLTNHRGFGLSGNEDKDRSNSLSSISSTGHHSERRDRRLDCADHAITALIPLRGHLKRYKATLIDFNIYGAAVSLAHPLATDTTAFMTLEWSGLRVTGLVCQISNCLRATSGQPSRYRCGLRFRVISPLQLDRYETTQLLRQFERQLAAANSINPLDSLPLPRAL
jgi:hypothetical protein